MNYYDDDKDEYFYEEVEDLTTDVLGTTEIGGVGQVSYPIAQFKNYDWDYINDELVAYPVLNGSKEDYTCYSDISGRMLLIQLCNLAKAIDNPESDKPHSELIINWCKKYVHPYFVDSLNALARDEQFDAREAALLIQKEATFSIAQFMDDLNRLYFALRFYTAIDATCMGNDDLIPSLCKGGRYFDDLPYFEKYRFDPEMCPDVDYSSTGGNLLQEMLFDAAASNGASTKEFVRTPYDDYDELRAKLVDLIPSFDMRPKLNPRTKRYVFANAVHSIFDICWYTFARMVVDDAPPEKKTQDKPQYKGVVYVCLHCGRYFYRKRGEQLYCMRPECQHARKAKNQRDHRNRARLKKANQS